MLLGYWDFKAIAHTDSQQVGGKGGGGTRRVTQTTYTYQSAILGGSASARKTCRSTRSARSGERRARAARSRPRKTYVLAGVTQAVVHAAQFTQDRGVSVSTAVEHDYDSTTAIPMAPAHQLHRLGADEEGHRRAGAGQYKQVGGTYTFNAADIGKTVRISYSYNVPAADNQPTRRRC
jgi:hypothetical protein